MALPKQVRPEYSTTIPSSNKRIKYQPFSVKEEKILVLAAESQDPSEISNAIVKVLGNCIVSPTDISIEDLALFDIEYLFLKARSKSAGEKIEMRITDPGDETFSVDHEINVDKIGISRTEGHSDKIELAEDTFVIMSYPGIEFFNEGINTNNINAATNLIAKCVKQIVVGDEVYNQADMSDDEVVDWLESMTTEQFKKVTNFFETMPKLKHTITRHNPHTDKDFTIELEGLGDFFS
tara:strand:- start:122 stop:832 length:711 start_codon:yes stop_codon:yes gene_type:complete